MPLDGVTLYRYNYPLQTMAARIHPGGNATTASFLMLLRSRVQSRFRALSRACFQFLLSASLIAFLCAVAGCGSEAAKPLRIVLITLDTLRWDSFAESPDAPSVMPALRGFSKTALVFSRHYTATSSTQPTHATLFTGLHAWQHHVPRNGAILPGEFQTIVERMQDAGFRTGAVVASFPLHRSFGFDQGFDWYEDDFEKGDTREWSEREVPGNFSSDADTIYSKAMQMLDQMGDAKQFLWVHFFDPHSPYGDSAGEPLARGVELKLELDNGGANIETLLTEARKGYAVDVRFLDIYLALILKRLQDEEASIETHIIVVADHGESFGEAGSVGHGKRLTEEQIHVPLLIRSPRVAAGVSDVATGSVDVAATLLALAGVPESAPNGRDLTQALNRETPVLGMRRTFETPYLEQRSDGSEHIIDGGWFYAVEGGRVFKGSGSEVIANDSEPIPADVVDRLSGLFRGLSERAESQDIDEKLDPETREQLEALGYVR